jgi:hypothetical protein
VADILHRATGFVYLAAILMPGRAASRLGRSAARSIRELPLPLKAAIEQGPPG